MKVLIDIPKSTYKDIKESYSITCGENFAQKLVKYIKNGVPLPKGVTNGDVIKSLFPNISIYEHGSTYSVNNEYNFNSTWWNAPYKEEIEETQR